MRTAPYVKHLAILVRVGSRVLSDCRGWCFRVLQQCGTTGFYSSGQNVRYLCPTSQSKGLPAVPAGKISFLLQVSDFVVGNLAGNPLP